MKFYVSRCGNKIKSGETNPEAGLPMESHWQMFWTEHDTEDAARAFIVERAKLKVVEAKQDIRNATRMLAKCIEKFGGAK